jgi:sporulation protein YqfC
VRGIRETVADSFELPKDVIMNLPKLSIGGNREIYIENYKGILEYTAEEIRLSTTIGVVRIAGKNLNIDRIRLNDIFVSGHFRLVEYEL